jgi:uncharacterized membrane protein YbaN (DUF454 family)
MERVVSAIPGRLRVRDPRFCDPAVARRVIDSTARELPVLDARANPAACSVVFLYDAKAIPLAEMRRRTEDALAACLASPSGGKPRKNRRRARRAINRYAKIGALSSLAASIFFAYTGSKRLHVVTGWVFVACLCAHLAVFRRTLAR